MKSYDIGGGTLKGLNDNHLRGFWSGREEIKAALAGLLVKPTDIEATVHRS